MEYKQELLRDVYWSFANGQYENKAIFLEELKAYFKEISGKSFSLDTDKIIVNQPKMVIQYMKYNFDEDEYDEPQLLLEADNGTGFSQGELMHKIHVEIGAKLEDDDNCYFEGLTFATDDDPDFSGIPVYFLDTGT